MRRDACPLIVVGGGPAGMAAALSAREAGLKDILIVERDKEPGGILNQCIHSGFGLHYFKEDLTGPEYAGRFIRMLEGAGVILLTDTTALEISPGREVHVLSRRNGYQILKAKAVVLAMGCRERTRGAIGIPGARPAGILTAGTAQRYINIEGYQVGKRILILGSGDVGLIMARRLSLQGAKVLACVELMPYSGGLTRNIVQCLHDFDIPLLLSHTVTDIRGLRRVEGVVVSRVDESLAPIPGTEIEFDCDTILLSVGLIPENELSRKAGVEIDPRTGGAVVFEDRETSLPGVFACGNALHVHDLADGVTEEGFLAGKAAAAYALREDPGAIGRGGEGPVGRILELRSGDGVSYTVPQRIRLDKARDITDLHFRASRVFGESAVLLRRAGETVARYKRERLAPGEMERIALPKQLLTDASAIGAGELVLSVEGDRVS